MKKIVFLGIIAALALSGCPLGSESNPKDVTVSEVKNQRNGIYVRLNGEIVDILVEKFYRFSDSTGSILVEIDNEVWARAGIKPASLTYPTRFEIVGEVDKEKGEDPMIEVESIKKL